VYPYLGGAADAGRMGLADVITLCGLATISGPGDAGAPQGLQGMLLDPTQYVDATSSARNRAHGNDLWLERQRAAGVPVILTDPRPIGDRNRDALRKALQRWENIPESSLAVLPIGNWWLKQGLERLIEDVDSAGRPVAIVLMHVYNGLNARGTVTGLLRLVHQAKVPVVLLRQSVAAMGVGAYATFIGASGDTRHGRPRIQRKVDAGKPENEDRDTSPILFVPALHDYLRASKLPALTGADPGVLNCNDALVCAGRSLLEFADSADLAPAELDLAAYRHNVASHEQVAREVFGTKDWRRSWWQRCREGADVTASMSGHNVSLRVSDWLTQWLELGPSPLADSQRPAPSQRA
jgi:hypothetical protein